MHSDPQASSAAQPCHLKVVFHIILLTEIHTAVKLTDADD